MAGLESLEGRFAHPITQSSEKPFYSGGLIMGVRALIHKERLTFEELLGYDVGGASDEFREHATNYYRNSELDARSGVLLIRRELNDSYSPGLWELPGGKMGDSMTIEQAIVREVHEETGLQIAPGKEATFWDDTSGTEKYAGCLYTCLVIKAYLCHYDERVILSHEHCGWRYVMPTPEYLALSGCTIREETREALDRFYRKEYLFRLSDRVLKDEICRRDELIALLVAENQDLRAKLDNPRNSRRKAKRRRR